MIQKQKTYPTSHLIKKLFYCLLILNLWNFSVDNVEAMNKESFPLDEKKFSREQVIDFKGIYEDIHYTFKNENLLREALRPLLPKRLQFPKQRFQLLEKLGDAVLELIITVRLQDLFPTENTGTHHDLCVSLVKNRTLADVYLRNLNIEQYLPFPERSSCKYCNVVEALIGAIYRDDSKKGFNNSKKFIMKILDDNVLLEKLKEVAEKNGSKSGESEKEELRSPLVSGINILPHLKEIIQDICQKKDIGSINTKSLLGEILTRAWNDTPSYDFSLGIHETDVPIFVATVSGAQIGSVIKGLGLTVEEAKQDAARAAINFLAQETLIPPKELDTQQQNYTKFINEYCLSKNLQFSFTPEVIHRSSPLFTFEAKIADEIIGRGSGSTKKAAAENAAREVCNHFVQNGTVGQDTIDPQKQHRSILKELSDKKLIPDVKLTQDGEVQPENTYKICVKVGEDVSGQGIGSLESAREKAYQEVFNQLFEKQEKERIQRETFRSPSKTTKSKSGANLKKPVKSSPRASLPPPTTPKKDKGKTPKKKPKTQQWVQKPKGPTKAMPNPK
ncbi:MAG: hypothetical protein BGO67_07775 [Alphaproteobacteria bacterium 41-28]|nr:MAG: hypothetical protein BGO67_07775 [Alphaproteobacteria bacterium 41-28]